MRRSKTELYVHFVWTTYRRYPWIVPEIEQQIYAAIRAEADQCGAEVLAIGGMPDHVHLVLKKPPTISESSIMHRIKGVSSTIIRQHILPSGEPFHWQENYAVFSFYADHADRIVKYVLNQNSITLTNAFALLGRKRTKNLLGNDKISTIEPHAIVTHNPRPRGRLLFVPGLL